jgi:polyhydroxybutyrate depolymerase
VDETFRGRGTGPVRRRLRERYQQRHGLEAPTGLTAEQIPVGKLSREFWCAAPPAGDPSAAPLLMVLHGAGGQGPGTASLTGLHHRAPAAGFVTVFPDGIHRVWNDSRTGGASRRREHVDDVGFLQALAARFASTGRAGDDVYLTGISNGALMSEHVARHGLLPVGGIGLVSGPGTQTSRRALPRPAHPAAVVVFAGTDDPLIPYAGGPIGPLGRMVQRRGGTDTDRGLAAAAETIAADWAAANGIAGGPSVTKWPTAADDLPVQESRWEAAGKPTVSLFRIEGGGHTWPGGNQYLPARIIGPVARSLDATGIILDHFRTRAGLSP